MFKFGKNGKPVSGFVRYCNLDHNLSDRTAKKCLGNPRPQQNFLTRLAMEGIINAIGIDYGVPVYQELPVHSRDDGKTPGQQEQGGAL